MHAKVLCLGDFGKLAPNLVRLIASLIESSPVASVWWAIGLQEFGLLLGAGLLSFDYYTISGQCPEKGLHYEEAFVYVS
jgi:hypothetical protein